MITTRKLRPHLEKCGYTDLIQEHYLYTDTSGHEREVPIVSFAYPSYDARSACIAAIDVEPVKQHFIEKLANAHRDLGAPVLLICCGSEIQWWSFKPTAAALEKTISQEDIDGFFKEKQSVFSPTSIYRAKNVARIREKHQLSFVDVGLMPVIEIEMGREVSRLTERMLNVLSKSLARPTINQKIGRWMFKSAFWLLAAKILKDKRVESFASLDLSNVPAVLTAVYRHYNAESPPESQNKRQLRALEKAAAIVNEFSSLRNLTVESLACVYENTLITPEVREVLGIHATPSYLVDYIVWQLSDWISEMPHKQRVVLEPTCGHAPFLTSALRLLRELYEGERADLHDYLKHSLIGVEKDLFAREIARLSLTLADVPNPNGWNLAASDVYSVNILPELARSSTILLCNPPFQDFKPKEQAFYKKKGQHLECRNRAAEVLWRTLPYMRKGSVFGVILPRGFMHRTDLRLLRDEISHKFELREICELPDNVFTSASHESVVLLGRRIVEAVQKKVSFRNIKIRRVKKWRLREFRDRYDSAFEIVHQAKLQQAPNFDFLVPELEGVWDFCKTFPQLSNIATVGKGLEYKSKPKEGEKYDRKKHLPPNAETINERKFAGAVKGYTHFDENLKLTDSPKPRYMSLDSRVIRRPGLGIQTGQRQVLLNYAPAGPGGPWRLKPLLDHLGHPVTSRFVVIRPKSADWSIEAIWAIVNSPLANAYIYLRSTKRDILVKLVKGIPLPDCDVYSLDNLRHLVGRYWQLYENDETLLKASPDFNEAKRRMLAIDSEVLRLYDLPPKLERQLLDLFYGWQRLGVDFDFKWYFPSDFKSWIPLHEYLSEEFQRSTVSFVKQWVEKVRSPEIIRALNAAAEDFGQD